jgi:hypothetical protein
LSVPQQQVVLDLLHAPRFADQAPAEIYATLLDETPTTAPSVLCTASSASTAKSANVASNCARRAAFVRNSARQASARQNLPTYVIETTGILRFMPARSLRPQSTSTPGVRTRAAFGFAGVLWMSVS